MKFDRYSKLTWIVGIYKLVKVLLTNFAVSKLVRIVVTFSETSMNRFESFLSKKNNYSNVVS